MKNSTILLISAISLGIAACGGGGGGGGNGASSTTNATPPANPTYQGQKNTVGTPVLTTVTKTQRAGYVTSDENENPRLPVKPKSESDFKFGGAYATYSQLQGANLSILGLGAIGNDGNPYTAYAIDDSDLLGVTRSAPSDHTWTGVNYTYLAAHRNGTFQGPTRGANGAITLSGNKWVANLGNVGLNGTLNGTDVSGVATGQFFGETVTGAFAGTDAKWGDTGVEASYGGFAGNNANVSFAGGWASEGQ